MAHPATPKAPRETRQQKLHRRRDGILRDIQSYLYMLDHDDPRRSELEMQLAPLGVTRWNEYHVQMAWGGPGYGFKLLRDPESKEFVAGTFYYADWFTLDEIDLSPSEVADIVRALGLNGLD